MKLLPNGELLMYFRDSEDIKRYTRSVITVPGIYGFGYRNIRKALPEVPEHRHSDCYEFFYITKGSFNIKCGEQFHTLHGGDAVIIKPGQQHSSGSLPLSIHEGFYFQLRADADILGISSEWSKTVFDRLARDEGCVLHPGAEVAEYMRTALEGVVCEDLYSRYRASAAILQFVYALIDVRIPDKKRILSKEIAGAVAYIDSHIKENPSLTTVAKVCELSLSSFKHRFSDEMGISPMEYINKLRVEEAKKLLAAGWSVTDTAYELDFTSSNYFSVVFRRYTSMTASQYRDTHWQRSVEL